MKKIIRVIIVLIIIAFIINIEPTIEDNYRILFVTYMLLTGISLIFVIFYIFFHCKKISFKSNKIKKFWFTILYVGLIFAALGHLLYYFVVIELNIGVLKEIEIEDDHNR